MADGQQTQASISFRGMDRLLRKMSPAILQKPIRDLLQSAAYEVEAEAKKRAPVDTGLLRSSITTSIDFAPVPKWSRAGTNVHYAPYMEFGTGTLAVGEPKKGGRHFPPSGALDTWASRHGFGEGNGFLVARAIGLRGGLKPRRFLTGGMQAAMKKFPALINRAADAIRAEFGKGS